MSPDRVCDSQLVFRHNDKGRHRYPVIHKRTKSGRTFLLYVVSWSNFTEPTRIRTEDNILPDLLLLIKGFEVKLFINNSWMLKQIERQSTELPTVTAPFLCYIKRQIDPSFRTLIRGPTPLQVIPHEYTLLLFYSSVILLVLRSLFVTGKHRKSIPSFRTRTKSVPSKLFSLKVPRFYQVTFLSLDFLSP